MTNKFHLQLKGAETSTFDCKEEWSESKLEAYGDFITS